MPCYTLVVVDMQPSFEAANKPEVIVGVTKEIITAMACKNPVVFVEYCSPDPPTHSSLLSLVKDYELKAKVTKSTDDGSVEVIQALEKNGFYGSHLRVCGVNAEACVMATVNGLLDQMPFAKVEVVPEACGTIKRRFPWRQIKSLCNHRNFAIAG